MAGAAGVMSGLPNATATERNRGPILAVLREWFGDRRRVLEIGSGTGQHALHFAAAMPQLVWQTSDLPENHGAIQAWIDAAHPANVLPPWPLDVSRAEQWPDQRFDAVFSANTLHIMGWQDVQALFANLPRVLADSAVVVIYGPFNIGGQFTSESNAAFDAQLRAQAPHRGIRDKEAVDALAQRAGLRLVADIAMPANNRCLVWLHQIPPTA
jgi:cyclopropane fatty-acyl-phospholipid synthase-like methyltransferase